MMENMYTPVAGLGIVPGNATADNRLIEIRQKNARNPMRNTMCYPGGDAPQNHSILKGDLLFAQRGSRCVEDAEGGMQQAVTATVNGECWSDYNSQREMEHNYVFAGVSAGDQMIEHPLSGDRNELTGVGTVLVGTVSTINNGPRPFYTMDWVSVKWPESGLTPNKRWWNRHNVNSSNQFVVDGGDPDNAQLNMLTYTGEEPTVFKPQVVPFNPADLDVELAGVFSSLMRPKVDGGSEDAKLEEILPQTTTDQLPTAAQEESASYEFALFGMFRAMLEPLLAKGVLRYESQANDRDANYGDEQAGLDARAILTNDIDLFDRGNNSSLRRDMLSNVFMAHIGGMDSLQKETIDRFAASRDNKSSSLKSIATTRDMQSDDDRADYIRVYGLELLVSAMAKTVHAQREKIVGRALNAAACGETLDLLLGHTN